VVLSLSLFFHLQPPKQASRGSARLRRERQGDDVEHARLGDTNEGPLADLPCVNRLVVVTAGTR